MARQSGFGSSLKDKVYGDLKDKIVFGELLPGTVLSEEELCRVYKMSRTPVREALLQLKKEGYISIEPRRSTRVSKISIQEMNDIIESRVLIEVYILRSQTGPLNEKFLEKLRDIGRRFRALEPSDPDRLKRFLRLDFEFHSLLVSLCGNEFLRASNLELLEKSVRQWYLMCVHSEGRMEDSMNEHYAIMDALGAARYEEACKLLEEHIKRFYDITFFY